MLDEVNAELSKIRSTPPPDPIRIEVPMVPVELTEGLAELAARAEAIAEQLDQ